jgi:hypothetical protein
MFNSFLISILLFLFLIIILIIVIYITFKSSSLPSTPTKTHEMNKLELFFHKNENKKLKMDKWHHYFKIYDRHFKHFMNKNPIILEIGVYNGGSLEMWNHYFDGQCTIIVNMVVFGRVWING